jgi:hypothetical protein
MVPLMNFHWSSPVGRPVAVWSARGAGRIDLRVEYDFRVEPDPALFLRPFRRKSIVTLLPLERARSEETVGWPFITEADQ